MKLNKENLLNYFGIKQKPKYFYKLVRYSENSPIFIAIDWNSLNCLHRFNSVCLLCNESSYCYDLSFCYDHEIWVFYAHNKKLNRAMQLARAVQLAGATKTLVILLDAYLVERSVYAK